MHYYATQFDTKESTEAYRVIQAEEEKCAKQTLQFSGEQVSVWHRLLTLHHEMLHGKYTGFSTIRYTGDRAGIPAWNARAALLSTAGRTSKLAMDTALTGYYSESAALDRIVIESWAQAVLLRFRRMEASTWYRADRGDQRQKTPPTPKSLFATLKRTSCPATMIKLAEDLTKFVNAGSHPSPVYLNQLMRKISELENRASYGVVFHERVESLKGTR